MESQTSEPERARVFNHIWTVFATLSGLWWLYHMATLGRRLTYPLALDPCEPFSLNRALWLAKGGNIYLPVAEYPHFMANYPPVYEWLSAQWLTSGEVTYFWGRLISLGAEVGVCVLLGLIAWRHCRDWRGALLAGTLPAFSGAFWVFGALHRVDFLALFWTFLALYLFWLLFPSVWSLVVSLPLFLLAGYTKQTYFLAPLALWLVLRRPYPKFTLLFFGLYSLLGVGIFVLANSLTEGQFFLHTVWSQKNVFSLGQAVDFAFRPVGKMLPLWLLALWGAWELGRTPLREEERFWLVYLGLSWLWIWIGGGKEGASWNYFLEFVCLSSLVFTSIALRHPWKGHFWLLSLLLLAQLSYSFRALPRKDKVIWEKSRWSESARLSLKRLLLEHPELQRVMAHNTSGRPNLWSADAIVLATRPVGLNVHYYLMGRTGLWSLAAIDYVALRGQVDLLVLDTATPPVGYERHYQLWRQVGEWYLWRKKGP